MSAPEINNSQEAAASRARLDLEVQAKIARDERRRQEHQAALKAGKTEANPIAGIIQKILGNTANVPAMSDQEEKAMQARFDAECRASLARERREGRAMSWRTKCPPRFLETFDFSKVDQHVDEENVNRILEWRFGPLGLYIVGPSRRSKTRAVFSLLARLHIEEARRVHFLDGIAFANQAARAWGNCDTTEAWLKTMTDPEVLFIDDLAKKWTPSTEEAAFCVLDRRAAWKKPSIVTLNYSMDQMRAFSTDQDVLEPFLARVGEFCEVITF